MSGNALEFMLGGFIMSCNSCNTCGSSGFCAFGNSWWWIIILIIVLIIWGGNGNLLNSGNNCGCGCDTCGC